MKKLLVLFFVMAPVSGFAATTCNGNVGGGCYGTSSGTCDGAGKFTATSTYSCGDCGTSGYVSPQQTSGGTGCGSWSGVAGTGVTGTTAVRTILKRR